jgi:hypothetical protein
MTFGGRITVYTTSGVKLVYDGSTAHVTQNVLVIAHGGGLSATCHPLTSVIRWEGDIVS